MSAKSIFHLCHSPSLLFLSLPLFGNTLPKLTYNKCKENAAPLIKGHPDNLDPDPDKIQIIHIIPFLFNNCPFL